MHKLFYTLLAAAAMSFAACSGEQQNGQSATTQDAAAAPKQEQTATPPPALPVAKPPFEIADSSKVMELEGGVKLYLIQEGSGIAPTLETTVLANYHGRLKNGDVFDSSFDRGQPVPFPLNGVIKGWQVGFSKMKPGSRFVLVIPPDMGYGPQAQAKIPANSTLIFDCDFITTL